MIVLLPALVLPLFAVLGLAFPHETRRLFLLFVILSIAISVDYAWTIPDPLASTPAAKTPPPAPTAAPGEPDGQDAQGRELRTIR